MIRLHHYSLSQKIKTNEFSRTFGMSTAWPLKLRPIYYPETSVTNYHSALHNILAERRSWYWCLFDPWIFFGSTSVEHCSLCCILVHPCLSDPLVGLVYSIVGCNYKYTPFKLLPRFGIKYRLQIYVLKVTQAHIPILCLQSVGLLLMIK